MYKKLLGQTAIYGLSTVIIRLFPFVIAPIITHKFGPETLSPFVDFYSIAGIIIVLLSHGMETTFFRFAQKHDDDTELISTASLSVIGVSLLFLTSSLLYRKELAVLFKTPDQIGFLTMMLLILATDGICTMPFVILRKTGRSKKFALIKISNGVVNFVLLLFFLVLLPREQDGILGIKYSENIGIGYVFIANLIASGTTLILLFRELFVIRLTKFRTKLWLQMMKYSLPVTIAGLAGVVNETLDRQFLKYLLPQNVSMAQMAIYGSVCKIVTFMTLFRQAYLLGIEPFFFSHAKKENAGAAYAKLMDFFVVANCIILLFLCANLNWISKFYLHNPAYNEGIPILPIVLIASLFLGVYLNLSIWYKLCDKTIIGAYLSVVGAIVTVAINLWFIPKYGYWASAWATLASYFTMMIASYLLGKKIYPIAYHTKKIAFYIVCSICFSLLAFYVFNGNIILGNGLLLIFLGTVLLFEKEFRKRFKKS